MATATIAHRLGRDRSCITRALQILRATGWAIPVTSGRGLELATRDDAQTTTVPSRAVYCTDQLAPGLLRTLAWTQHRYTAHEPISARAAAGPVKSKATAERDLKSLVSAGWLHRHGTGRGTWYYPRHTYPQPAQECPQIRTLGADVRAGSSANPHSDRPQIRTAIVRKSAHRGGTLSREVGVGMSRGAVVGNGSVSTAGARDPERVAAEPDDDRNDDKGTSMRSSGTASPAADLAPTDAGQRPAHQPMARSTGNPRNTEHAAYARALMRAGLSGPQSGLTPSEGATHPKRASDPYTRRRARGDQHLATAEAA